MPYRLAIAYALVLALATGLCAATAQLQTMTVADVGASTRQASTIPLGWAPDWLARPLSRALADATDPRQRDKETGLPKEGLRTEVAPK